MQSSKSDVQSKGEAKVELSFGPFPRTQAFYHHKRICQVSGCQRAAPYLVTTSDSDNIRKCWNHLNSQEKSSVREMHPWLFPAKLG